MEATPEQNTETTDVLLIVRLITQDSCAGTFTVQSQGGMRRQTSIDWPGGMSDLPTAEVQLELKRDGEEPVCQVITGELWRDLESVDLEDEFLDRVLHGSAVERAATELLGVTIPFSGTHAQAYLIGAEHGFDDYDVIGHPVVHRITVGHGIKRGDIFNVYCSDARKVGGNWTGSLVTSFASVLEQMVSETAA